MIDAKIIEDSVNEFGDRLTTMQVVMHRFVLAEFNTHRAFSRNSASSRAIPLEKQLQMVKENPAFPLEWRAEQSGMQSGKELTGAKLKTAKHLWMESLDATVDQIENYISFYGNKEDRLHKSWVNRLLEPYMWHTVCVTSTEWDNFFKQRCSPLAQPEIRVVAEKMRSALENSIPEKIAFGRYHLPYVSEEEKAYCTENGLDARATSAARCARISYLTQEGVRDLDKDFALYDRLCNPGDGPPHWSPLEHVATPVLNPAEELGGNFKGWDQLRHILIRNNNE